MSGFHIDGIRGRNASIDISAVHTQENKTAEEIHLAELHLAQNPGVETPATREVSVEEPVQPLIQQKLKSMRKQIDSRAEGSEAVAVMSRENPEGVNKEVHPAAVGSFLSGLLSALCFVLMVVVSFSPVWLVCALVICSVVFAFIAKWLSKRAFEDMYYARNRYSGRGFAAAGLALGIITLTVLIGLVILILFNVAFIAFS